MGDFPGGPVVKNPACSAVEGGWIPDGWTRILQAMEQLQ